MINPESVPDLPGVPVLDVDGDIIGSVERVFIHQDTGAPLWVSIHTHFDGAPNAFAPLDGARFDDVPGSALHVGLPRTVVEDAPVITSIDTLTTDDVHALRAYYSSARAATTTAPPQTGPDLNTVDVVRSEEQLRVSTVSVPKERIRFEKVIVTEEKTVTVTVRREELRIIREPVEAGTDMAVPDGQVSAADLDIVLHEERIITTTEVVPVERVRVRVTQVTKDLPVTDTVRKERIDLNTTAS
ncbi:MULTISPECIES: YsnF/AvaK domain-containing protein [unclassified Frondihabitans]|uniref:YsnF/AvaK domain-containing protein n=1 Tax=unclassified Frondihabitans TaxID=2626248 RepID=UPI000F4E9071|nr:MULTISPECIES: YsnF/AvaK domain-containing protein [unclassified Frondihabitans]RPE77629.1 uncharacterized protein (TIGR02271 family) [Frondihabitans sp. PhB153]RPF07906.1 uncharacterized protein (TIGR02271 family) [Frondihabitans sp. PhB161]